MTVLLALLTQDGVVFASDSQENFLQAGQWIARRPVQKIFFLGRSMLYGCSGEIGMTQRVKTALEASYKGSPGIFSRPIDKLILHLRDLVFPILQDVAKHTISVPGWPTPVLHTILCGFHKEEGFWIADIDPRGNVERHTHRGFCVVGSGGLTGQFALQCLAHLEIERRVMYQGQLVAYRVVDDVIRAGIPFVGGEVQMFLLTKDGVENITGSKLEDIKTNVGAWKEIEKHSLGQVKERAEGFAP